MSKEERRKERQEIYQSKRWVECRDFMRQKYPLCQDCLSKGIIKPMEEVHHLKSPFARNISEEEKERRAYSEDNLVCLCRECHWRRHHPEGIIQDKLDKYRD